jgi:hypothetical protein
MRERSGVDNAPAANIAQHQANSDTESPVGKDQGDPEEATAEEEKVSSFKKSLEREKASE